MSEIFVGIDTSNYRTSLAAVDSDGRILFQKRELLTVERGEKGLRQETALFIHNERVPIYLSEMMDKIDRDRIVAISCSYRPRSIKGSYMPVFLAGVHAAEIISTSLGIPCYRFSHQEGHIASAVPENINNDFIFMHLSGGTTECLLCKTRPDGYETDIACGTLDISIGQLLDRAGVAAGYDFPAGAALDAIACSREAVIIPPKITLNSGNFNLSGIETFVLRSIEKDGLLVVPGLFMRIAELLNELAEYTSSRYDINDICISGGVAESSFIRKNLVTDKGCNIMFGDPALSGDNAVGIARLGKRRYYGTGNGNPGK